MGQYDLAVGHLEKARTFQIANKALLRLLYYYSAAVMILRGDFDTAQIRLLLLAREGVASDELMEAYGLAALRVASLPGRERPELRTVVLEVGRLVANAPHLRVKEASVEFERLIAKYPSQSGLRYAYGKYLASHALYVEACEAFKQEVNNSPQDAMARLQLATIQSQQLNGPAEALPVAEEAVKLNPQLFASHFVLGRILLKLGETGRAVRELETAAQQAPDSVMVHTTLLHAYNKAKRREDAAREQEVLRRLQEFEAAIKGETSSHVTKAVPQENGELPEAGPQ
jgi:predicted Zn-dependent protease